MAPSSPLLSQPSPTKKSSQELPLFVNLAETAEPLPPNSARSRLGGNNGPSLLAIAEPAPAADLTPSLIADEMDVDNGARLDDEQLQAAAATVGGRPSPTAGQQAAAASQPAQQSQAAAPAAVRTPVRTPELQTTLPQRQASRPPAANGTYHEHANGRGTSQAREASPSTPGRIPPFDWEEFEARYEQALSEMNGQERDMLEEFDRLVNYFNVWASAASAHDDERAVKRLQTRERYVKIAEQSLGQRKQHLTEVVRAFQSALALLSQS